MTRTIAERRGIDMLGDYLKSLPISKNQYNRVNPYMALVTLPDHQLVLHYVYTKGKIRWGKVSKYTIQNKDLIFDPTHITWNSSIRNLKHHISQQFTIVK